MTMHVYDKHELMLLPGLAPDERTPQRLPASSVMMISIYGLGLADVVSERIGRWSFMIFSAPITINWLILYYARTMFTFILSRFLADIALGGHWISFFNFKAIVIGCLNCISFSNGYILGQVTSMISALRAREEGIDFTDAQISLIASSVLLISICGQGLAAVVSDKVGRRWAFMIFSTPTTVNWIVLYYARDLGTFMLSRVLAGVALGALLALKICVTSEYTGPRTRAVFLNMISTLAPALGNLAGHSLGIILPWRIVALIGIIPSVFGIFIPYFWVESPHWLASKGRFEECEVAFRKLHGKSPVTESELEFLLKVEKTKLQKAEETNSIQTLKKLLIACKRTYFWDLMLVSVFISAFLAAAGKASLSTLAVAIIEGITGSSDVLYFTLVVDVCVIVGASLSCFLITKMSMRTMLFMTSVVSIGILVFLAGCLFFKTGSIYFQWGNVCLMGLYFLIVNSGPYPILEALMGEIYPLELKVYCFFLSGAVLMSSLSLTIALLPTLVTAMGYHGLFLLNAGIMSISVGYIWFRLPETKGRTLQEIEIYFKTKKFRKLDEVLLDEQVKALI